MQLDVGTPERRQVRNPTESILSSYQEMPGLILHLNQAARLFGLREATCRTVLDELVRQGKLRRAADGQYLAV
jgi:DNA-binding IclR family transcriptional regulator